MKRWIAIVMAAAVLTSMAGCGSKMDDTTIETVEKPTKPVETTVPETTVPPTTAATTPSTEAPKPTEEQKMWVNETEPFTPPAEDPELMKELESVGITDVVNSWETTPEKPAKLGQWVRISKHSTESGKHEVVFVRIVGTYEADQARIEEYNAAQFSDRDRILVHEELRDVAHFRGMTYEMYYPKAFPNDEYPLLGMHSFTLVNPNDRMGNFELNGEVQYYVASGMKGFDSDEGVMPGNIVSRDAVYTVLNDSTDILYVFDGMCHIVGSDNEEALYPYYLASE